MKFTNMPDEKKRRELSDRKEFLNMDIYISRATGIAENRYRVSPRTYMHTVESSREFKKQMRKCVTYYNKVENDSISQNFVSDFIKIEENLKEAHKGDIHKNAEELKNQVSELAESWRATFGLEKSIRTPRGTDISDYPYPPRMIHLTLGLMASERSHISLDFPHKGELKIMLRLQEILNSDIEDEIEIEADFDIAGEDNVSDGEHVKKSEFLAALENIRRAEQEASYGSLTRSDRGSNRDNLITLMSKYRDELGLSEDGLPPEMHVHNFRNVFLSGTKQPEEFRESADDIVIGMGIEGMTRDGLDSIGHISRGTMVTHGDYGENLARILGNLSNYAQDAYNATLKI